ncbi:ribose-5-phosphate isomerase RpiA [Halovulum sp. GXIMD14794]
MLDRLDPPARAKLTAAYHAMEYVEDDMRIGLGTGSTAEWLVLLLGARRHIEGLRVKAVSTSERTEALAKKMGLQTGTLEEIGWLDLTIDGADEVDPMLSLIKGGGGSLLREKIVAAASERMVVIADDSKRVETLGAFPLPVEVVRFGWTATRKLIEDVLSSTDLDGTTITVRQKDGEAFLTDEQHFILDLHLEYIDDVDSLGQRLLAVPGVVETGLFVDIADTAIFGMASGEVKVQVADGAPAPLDPPSDDRLREMLAYIETHQG